MQPNTNSINEKLPSKEEEKNQRQNSYTNA